MSTPPRRSAAWKVGDAAQLSDVAPRGTRGMYGTTVGVVVDVGKHSLVVRMGNVRLHGMRIEFRRPT
jgi:hypothetical protein